VSEFPQFLNERLDAGGFSTEDALASFLPLAREVAEIHAGGWVAPLCGVNDLRVDGVRLWFEESKRRRPTAGEGLERVERSGRAVFEVVGEQRVSTSVDDGESQILNLAIGNGDSPVTRPVYLPAYEAWEHRLGRHDPLTDVFSLGMLLASLACGLDLAEKESLERFVAHRKNLFALTSGLHPVVARVIVRMTELDRRRRPSDLASLVGALENYREQEVDFDYDLAATDGFAERPKHDKRTVVLTKLRERLFELSRRNRLLHFQPTMQSVNLTHASVPLAFNVESIRPDQVLTWSGQFERDVSKGATVSLNKYLNFSEVLYLPSQLERLIAEARRDRAEFGFVQLRLVVCFLHWANLKEKPVEQYESPLVLVPVELKKKKGIRDTYSLEPIGTEAEVNPVVRHQFKQLYDIDLPETIDLAETRLDDFYEDLKRRVEASEAAVTLGKVDRPRIQLIHEKAKRKLDQYRKKARLAGRGVSKFLDLDYSYDAANYHPLGVKLFSAMIKPPATHLRTIVEESPRPRTFAVPDPTPSTEKERQTYVLQSGAEASPYEWTFDLCSVTLANFRYRRMSLVRDYEALLATDDENPAFEAVFSLVPRPRSSEPTDPRPLGDRFDVVPCDPTQAMAIADAAGGKSYIIQGPPGTGKSQTITNLIADFVARGKRVLFVCEKRAAIDVVYARLKQVGLDDLCSLIHDSQADKKAFVMGLKQTYERFSLSGDADAGGSKSRDATLAAVQGNLAPLERFDRVMQSTPDNLGLTVRRLIDRCIDMRGLAPPLDPLAAERLPTYAEWSQNSAVLGRFVDNLRYVGGGAVLATHPLRLLSGKLADEERPLERLLQAVAAADPCLERAEAELQRCGVPREQWEGVRQAGLLTDYAVRLTPLSEVGALCVMDPAHERSLGYQEIAKRLAQAKAALAANELANANWTDRLSTNETDVALEQAETLKKALLPWLRPGWWRLRGVLKKCYDFNAHKVRPSWSRVLTQLKDEHEARQVYDRRLAETGDALGVAPDRAAELSATVQQVAEWLLRQPPWLQKLHAAVLRNPRGAEIIARVNKAATPFASALAELDGVAEGLTAMTLTELRHSLRFAAENAGVVPDFLKALRDLEAVPPSLRGVLRELPHPVAEIEAAVAERSLADALRFDREAERFTAAALRGHASEIESHYDRWLGENAREVCSRVQRRFLDNLAISETSAANLTSEQKEFKKVYTRGRRELEHEFGKQMRYKPIRELVSGESGEVVNDLKPVWLMSPLSVSDTLPLDGGRFDVVIFDEASQVTLEEAAPALCRAPQTIVVGDEMQLPPTDFFSAKQSAGEEDETLVESDGELVQYDLDSGSFLSHAAKNLPSTMLGWHYRSRSESLISFSNWAFYDGRLLTVPEESLPGAQRTPIVAGSATDGRAGAGETLRRPVSFHSLPDATYDKSRNRGEAEYLAEMVRGLIGDQSPTIGIVAFSEAQQDEIEQALSRLAEEDNEFAKRLEAEYEREEGGQYVGLLVKNLENIQGDERDIILLSVCYGRPPVGKMRMNFGPINKSGGEKRLNVAFSRAKRHMAVVSSIDSSAITNDYNDGANCLKNYLRYAEAASIGDAETAKRILGGLSRWRDESGRDSAGNDTVARRLAAELRERGYRVDLSVGQSHFRCDLAVACEGDEGYRLGVLIDSDAYYEQSDLIERDMMRPRLLRAFGWRISQVLAKDYFEKPGEVVAELVRELTEARK
jgi:hypothetical protein